MKDTTNIRSSGVSAPLPSAEKDFSRGTVSPDSGFSEKIWFARNLAVLSIAAQFIIHAWWQAHNGNPAWALPRLTSWLQDAILIFILYMTGSKLFKPGGSLSGRRSANFFYMFIWPVAVFFLMIYPRHIPDFINFPVNIFTAGAGAVKEFTAMFISREEMLILPAVAILTVFISYSYGHVNLLRTGRVINYLFFIIAFSSLFFPPSHPVVFSLQDSIVSGLFGGGRQFPLIVQSGKFRDEMSAGEASARPPGPDFLNEIDSRGELYKAFPVSEKISHTVVIVMETVEGKRFKKELFENKNTFIGSRAGEFRYFSRYFTLNLDSYTSLIAMLTSVFVPFRAYSDADIYSGITASPNLAAAMKKAGTACMFVSTARNQPFIPVRDEWDKILMRADIPEDPSMAHIDSPPIESAVEDRAAAGAIVDFMRSRSRSFVMQECVYGHTQAWSDLTGRSQLEYYDLYVRELIEKISAAGLRERTLLILVADHGSRQDPAEFENYRVPLIIWGPGVKPGEDDRFLSHLDFSGLVAEAFSGKNWRPSEKPLMTVGHSGKWVYGEIRGEGEFQFLDNLRGRVLSSGGSSNPVKLNEKFQLYVNDFSSRFPGPGY